MDNARYYDEFSERYDEGRERGYHAFIDGEEERFISRFFRRGARILEAGCGTGLLLSRMAARGAKAQGFDLSSGMLSRARSRGHGVAMGDIAAPPFQGKTFDLVYSVKVLPHLPDARRAIEILGELVAEGGYLVIEFYNPISLRRLNKWLFSPRKISKETDESAVTTVYHRPSAARRLVPEGFRLEATRGIRILTPHAALHGVPILGNLLRLAERSASMTPLDTFGGFYLVAMRRTAPAGGDRPVSPP